MKPGFSGAYKTMFNVPTTFSGGKKVRDQSEHFVTTPIPVEEHLPTPHPFLHGPVWGPSYHCASWDLDVDVHDTSMFPDISRMDKGLQQAIVGRHSPAITPLASGNIKSRKEGMSICTPAATKSPARHNQNLVLNLDQSKTLQPLELAAPNASPQARTINNIKASNEPTLFTPGHRSGLSSMERVESQLYSALGEELKNLEHNALANEGVLFDFKKFRSPQAKRKRLATLGGERGSSPDTVNLREAAEKSSKPVMRGD